MNFDYFRYTGDNRYGKVIAKATADALKTFCRQEPEFEQAVEQSGKTFDECISSICKGGLGGGCSDLEVYAKAVRFYFPGADVSMNMTINMSGDVEAAQKPLVARAMTFEEKQALEKDTERLKAKLTKLENVTPSTHVAEPKKLTLDLDDFLDF